MPQPKTPPKPDPPKRDPLAKLLDPLGLVVLTRELVQEAFEDAVRRGRMTRDDAQDLATALLNRHRQNQEELVSRLEQLFGGRRPGRRTEIPAAEPRGGGSRNGPPLEDYDELTAAQITARLGDLTPAQLRRVRDHERRNANRKSVLQAVERKLR